VIIKSYEIIKEPFNFLKHNLFLLYGENLGLKKDIKDSIKKSYQGKEANFEVLSLYEEDIINKEENFYNSIYSGSLFSNKKIVIINNGTDKIIDHIKKVSETTIKNIIVIVFSNILEKKSKLRNFFEKSSKTLCIPCYSDTDRDLETIARNELGINNITLPRDAINLLIEKSNNDRDNLKSEIEKIASFSLTKKKIDIEDIKSIINFSGEHKSDNLVNECLCGNINQYKKILSELYTGTLNQVFLLRILSIKIQRLLTIKEQQNKNNHLENLLNTTRPPIFWKEKPIVKKQLSIWSLNELKKIIYEINTTETLCKTKPQIAKIIFFNFFNKLCKKASSFS